MNWEQLYSYKRLGQEDRTKDKARNSNRSSFIKDYDRLIFSAPFRRLQSKTQVFPLPKDIFVHNRLTHSLEVASVGRSLGSIVGQKIIEKYQFNEKSHPYQFYNYELQNVIAAACLSHDIGNPPFGHAGEQAISQFYDQLQKDSSVQITLNDNEWADLKNFEGNANGFRILTKDCKKVTDEFRLTYTTLASMIKYPCSSIEGNNKSTGLISTKKYGFFETERENYLKVVQEFNLPLLKENSTIYARHPFVYLVEAADDICYLVIDMEDAFNIGLVTEKECLELFLNFIKEETGYFSYASVSQKLSSFDQPEQKIAFLRAVVINILIQKVTAIFMKNETALLKGNLNASLTDLLEDFTSSAFKELENFSVTNIYRNTSVVKREIAGYKVLNDLLSLFTECVLYPKNSKSKLTKRIIPTKYLDSPTPYTQLRNVLDYVSSMTDLQAVQIHKDLNGLS